MLFQLHIGDAVHQKSAHSVGALKHGDTVASLVELVCHGKAGGTASHYCYFLSGTNLGRLRVGISFFICILYDGILIFLGSHRFPDEIAGTCRLTECRTYSRSKFRKAVGLF